jgi:hypothetical protein
MRSHPNAVRHHSSGHLIGGTLRFQNSWVWSKMPFPFINTRPPGSMEPTLKLYPKIEVTGTPVPSRVA